MEDLVAIGQRLKTFMVTKGIGVNKLGTITGTSGAQIHNIVKGRKYGTDKLLNIFKVFPDLNVPWLLFGESEMPNGQIKAEDQSKIDELQINNKRLYVEIELLNLMREKYEGLSSYQLEAMNSLKASISITQRSYDELNQILNHLKSFKVK